MKKLLLAAVPLALLMAHLVRVQIVAAPAAPDTADTAKASPGAAPARPENARALPPPVMNPEEHRALRSLAKPTNVDFLGLSVSDAVQYLAEYHNLPIRFDEAELTAATIPVDSPVTLKLDGDPFQRILNLLLIPLGLDWYVEGAGLIVTTPAAAATPVRSRLEKLLEPELKIIDHICELTDAQRQKLQLAGRGDIQRLLGGIQERQTKFQLVKNDEKKVAELLREIEQFQRSIGPGPFGNGSLFRKILETLLTPQQMVKYEPIRDVLQAGGLVSTRQQGSDAVLGVLLIQSAIADEGLARLNRLTNLGGLRLDGSQVTDVGLAYLKDLTNLQELFIGATQVTDAGMVHLEGLKKLQVLSLYDTRVTDSGLNHLQGLANLRELNLSKTQVTDVGLAHLKGLANLHGLYLVGTQVTDVGLVHLKDLTNLQELDIGGTQVTDAGMVHLEGLKKLQVLSLDGTRFTDSGLNHLQGLANLQVLNLNKTQVTDAGLVDLKRLASLQRLFLGSTQVTDAGLVDLKGLTSLQLLNLNSTKVTAAGIADLNRALPKLSIVE